MENIVVVKCNAELLRSLGMKTWRIAPTWCALLYWPKIYVALKDTGQNLNKRHIRLMQKLKFSGIPDTRNTRWFWKKNRVGFGYRQKLRVRVGYRVPVGPWSQFYVYMWFSIFQRKKDWICACFWKLSDKLSGHVKLNWLARIFLLRVNSGTEARTLQKAKWQC